MTAQKRPSLSPYFLGLACLLLAGALWFIREQTDTKAASNAEESERFANHRQHGEKSSRSSNRRNRASTSANRVQPALHNYMRDTKYGLTRTGVQKVVDQVKAAFPVGDYPEPTTTKNIRRVRDQQITVLVECFSESLSLSSTQKNQLKHELVARANADFADFSGKLNKPFVQDGVQYTIVNGGAMRNLYRPASWLKKTNIRELCPLNEQQTRILWPKDAPKIIGLNNSPYASSDIMHDPNTGTMSGHPEDNAPNSPLTVKLLPLTPDQGFAMRELKPGDSKNVHLLRQSLILSRAQLTLSLLLNPEHLKSLQQALNE